MHYNTGLTIVPHEDLVSAVNNWKIVYKQYKKIVSEASDHAEVVWKSKPWMYRVWCQVKSGIFDPDEWWFAYGDYLQEHKITEWNKCKDFVPFYCYTNSAMAAEDCAKHALESGTHYLTARQVNFVHVFKDLEVSDD